MGIRTAPVAVVRTYSLLVKIPITRKRREMTPGEIRAVRDRLIAECGDQSARIISDAAVALCDYAELLERAGTPSGYRDSQQRARDFLNNHLSQRSQE